MSKTTPCSNLLFVEFGRTVLLKDQQRALRFREFAPEIPDLQSPRQQPYAQMGDVQWPHWHQRESEHERCQDAARELWKMKMA